MDEFLINFIRKSPDTPRPEGLTPELIVQINNQLIEDYKRKLNMDSPYVRRGECRLYLQIHEEAKKAEGDWDKLDKLGKYEISEAFLVEYGE